MTGQRVFLTIGYVDKRIIEIFIDVNLKDQSSFLRTSYMQFARCVSISLQHGVPLRVLIKAFYKIETKDFPVQSGERFVSIYDYAAKMLRLENIRLQNGRTKTEITKVS